MWGNDPSLGQAERDAGGKPIQSWFSEQASALWESLKVEEGVRQGWGWNGRLNGPGMSKLRKNT
jgi:hypothetical protein